MKDEEIERLKAVDCVWEVGVRVRVRVRVRVWVVRVVVRGSYREDRP